MVEFVLQLEGFGLRQFGLEIGGGAAIGGIIGFAAKKIAKIIAVLIGLELALFKFLETRGILEVNWEAIRGTASNTTAAVSNGTASVSNGTAASGGGAPPSWVTSLLSALPVSAGFSGGFLVGFKKG